MTEIGGHWSLTLSHWLKTNTYFSCRYIAPLHYRLLLHPNLTSLSFTGSVQIEIDVQNNTNWVVLHNKGLKITKATILNQDLAHLSDQVAVNFQRQRSTVPAVPTYIGPNLTLCLSHFLSVGSSSSSQPFTWADWHFLSQGTQQWAKVLSVYWVWGRINGRFLWLL